MSDEKISLELIASTATCWWSYLRSCVYSLVGYGADPCLRQVAGVVGSMRFTQLTGYGLWSENVRECLRLGGVIVSAREEAIAQMMGCKHREVNTRTFGMSDTGSIWFADAADDELEELCALWDENERKIPPGADVVQGMRARAYKEGRHSPSVPHNCYIYGVYLQGVDHISSYPAWGAMFQDVGYAYARYVMGKGATSVSLGYREGVWPISLGNIRDKVSIGSIFANDEAEQEIEEQWGDVMVCFHGDGLARGLVRELDGVKQGVLLLKSQK